jgi:sugar phosphate isomerase/epimerase
MPGAGLRVSACSGSLGPDTDLLDDIDTLAAMGFDGVEISVMYHLLPDETTDARLGTVKQRLDDTGISASAMHFVFPPEFSLIRNPLPKTVAYLKRIAELAAGVGAQTIMAGGGFQNRQLLGMTLDEAEERIVEALASSAEACGPLGVEIAYEALNRFESNVGNTLNDSLRVVRAVGSPWVGVGGDTFHMNIEETDMAAAIVAVGDALVHLHLAENDRLSPGTGHIEFGPIFAALDAVGYAGWLAFETFFTTRTGSDTSPEFRREQTRLGLAHVRALQNSL